MITDKQPPELNEAELAAIDELHQPGWKKGIDFFVLSNFQYFKNISKMTIPNGRPFIIHCVEPPWQPF